MADNQGKTLPFKPILVKIRGTKKAEIKHICAYDEGWLAVGN